MKAIPKKDLRKLITRHCDDIVYPLEIDDLFEEYGDDYFIVDGEIKLVRKNERRIDPNNCRACELANECDHHICLKAVREGRTDDPN